MDNKSKEVLIKYVGHVIQDVMKSFEEDGSFIFKMDNGVMRLADEGRSCCEQRYIQTDDDIKRMVHSKLLNVEIYDIDSFQDSFDVHEMMFVHVKTSVGVFVFQTHNIHNGYYGGFELRLSEVG